MIVVNVFDPIVIIVLIYTVLITLVGLYNNPYPFSFLVLLTLFVVTSYCYYKVNKNEPILTPTCEKTTTTTPTPTTTTPYITTTGPTTTPYTTTTGPTTTPYTTTTGPTTTPGPTITPDLTTTPYPITTLPVI